MFLVVNERKEPNIWKSVLICGDIRPGKRTGRDARGSSGRNFSKEAEISICMFPDLDLYHFLVFHGSP